MITKIQKWGNSQGLRVAKSALEKAQMHVGDTVEIDVKKGQIIIKLKKITRKKYKLEDLLANMSTRREGEELDWGAPVGEEVW